MDDDQPTPETRHPVPVSRMSKTPSWIMLGFILGAAFVVTLPPWRKSPTPPAVSTPAFEPVKRTTPREPTPISTIEAVFTEWQRYAVWSDDVTEVALWNASERAYADFYEVRRFGDALFFRTIPKLTRRVISRGKHLAESPLQFTETEEQYQEWREHGRTERPAAGDLRPRAPSAPAVRAIDLAEPVLKAPAAERIAPQIEVPPVTPGGKE